MKNPYAVALGKKGGKAGTGAAKARTSEQARAALNLVRAVFAEDEYWSTGGRLYVREAGLEVVR